MGVSALEVDTHVVVVADHVARLQEEIQEVEPSRITLEVSVLRGRILELLLEMRNKIRVSHAPEVSKDVNDLRVTLQHKSATDIRSVLGAGPAPNVDERAIRRKVHKLGLDTVVVAAVARHPVLRCYVTGHQTRVTGIEIQPIAPPVGRLGGHLGKVGQMRDDLVNDRLAGERLPPVCGRKVPPLGQSPRGLSQPVGRAATGIGSVRIEAPPGRPSSQGASDPFGRIDQCLLQPQVERLCKHSFCLDLR